MTIERTKLPGVVVLIPERYKDERGSVCEVVGRHTGFNVVQSNIAHNKKGTIRGLHYQKDTAKLVWVIKGSILDVAIDPKTGKYIKRVLTQDNREQLYLPANFIHGFQALEEDTVVCYYLDQYYNPATEGGYNPNYIDWPIKEMIISEKDRNASEFSC